MFRNKKRTKETPDINAESMADIAFLLLIFFLVTTSMNMDKGLLVLLPPYIEDPINFSQHHERNVLEVNVNFKDKLMVEGEPTDIAELRQIAIQHIDNNGVNPNFSDTSQDAIVSLQNDKSTSYNKYIEVYNELKAAYNFLRNRKAETDYSLRFDQLDATQRKTIIKMYPIKLSEADPTDLET